MTPVLKSIFIFRTWIPSLHIINVFLKILTLFRSALDERTLHFQRTRKAKTKTENSKKSQRKSVLHGPVEPESKPMTKDELSFVHEAFQYLSKTFVGEVITNTEANRSVYILGVKVRNMKMDFNTGDSCAKSGKEH